MLFRLYLYVWHNSQAAVRWRFSIVASFSLFTIAHQFVHNSYLIIVISSTICFVQSSPWHAFSTCCEYFVWSFSHPSWTIPHWKLSHPMQLWLYTILFTSSPSSHWFSFILDTFLFHLFIPSLIAFEFQQDFLYMRLTYSRHVYILAFKEVVIVFILYAAQLT